MLKSTPASGALAVWFGGNENLPPEPGFERAQSSGGGTAKRRLDRRAHDQLPVRGGARACFALDEPQYLERQRKVALADAPHVPVLRLNVREGRAQLWIPWPWRESGIPCHLKLFAMIERPYVVDRDHRIGSP